MILEELEKLIGERYPLLAFSRANAQKAYGTDFRSEYINLLGYFQLLCNAFNVDPKAKLEDYYQYVLKLNGIHREYLKTLEYPAAFAGAPNDLDYNFFLLLSIAFSIHRFEIHHYFREKFRRYVKPGSRCLEVGTGTGIDAAFMSETAHVDTYDINPYSGRFLNLLARNERIHFHNQRYRFLERGAYDFVALIELVEHIEDPLYYLKGVNTVLKAGGHAFLTFAVRMPQPDHLYHYPSVSKALEQVLEAGLEVCEDFLAVSSLFPLNDADRATVGDKNRFPLNYCCVVHPRRDKTAVDESPAY
jgi:SAM-dependent methyltransferase